MKIPETDEKVEGFLLTAHEGDRVAGASRRIDFAANQKPPALLRRFLLWVGKGFSEPHEFEVDAGDLF
jgi:hypothetical protein